MTDRLIIRFSGGGLGAPGKIIQWATWSWCSHVEFEIPHHVTGAKLLGAMPGTGVAYRPIPTGTDIEPRVERYVVKGGYKFEDRVIKFAKTQIGSPYDWAGVIGYGIHRDWAEEGDWFCSEYVPWAWMKAGYPLLRADHVWRISPRDLLMSPLLERVE